MKRKILLWCEGETEMVYLRELMKLFPAFQADIRKADRNQPMAMIEDAGQIGWWSQYKANSYEHVFVFFDQDSNRTYEEAIEVSKKIPFLSAIWSNPCIEIWFLLHFRNAQTIKENLKLTSKIILDEVVKTQPKTGARNVYELITVQTYRKIADPNDCQKLLHEAWPQYKKNDTAGYLKTLKSHLEEARARAKGYYDPREIGTAFAEFLDYLSGKPLTDKTQQTSEISSPAVLPAIASPVSDSTFDNQSVLAITNDWMQAVAHEVMLEDAEEQSEPAAKTAHKQDLKIFLRTVKPIVPETMSIQECWATFKELHQILKKFDFVDETNREAAEHAILTAACLPWLDQVPLIILNCHGKGRAKQFFAQLLCSVANLKIPNMRAMPDSSIKPKYFDKEPVVLYGAKGTLALPQWLGKQIGADKSKLIVIYGNGIKTEAVKPFSLEVTFHPGQFDEKEFELLIAKHAPHIRQTALILAYMRNRGGNTMLRKYTSDFLLWKCLCASPLIWLGNKDISASMHIPTITKK